MVIRQINLHRVKIGFVEKDCHYIPIVSLTPGCWDRINFLYRKMHKPLRDEIPPDFNVLCDWLHHNLYLIVCAHHAFPIITFGELNVSYATHSHRRLAPLPGSPSSTITYFPSPNCPHTSVCRGTLFCMKVKASLCARFCCMGRRSI